MSEAPNALLLVHEGNSGNSALATAPVVPHIQSHSWGPAAPVPLHAADPAGLGLADRGSEDDATLFFIAAGNEAPFSAVVDWSRVHPAVQIVGGGSPARRPTMAWRLTARSSAPSPRACPADGAPIVRRCGGALAGLLLGAGYLALRRPQDAGQRGDRPT